jgi:hypothetical protein
MMKRLGMMSCSDMLTYLEEHTELTSAERVVFIEQNLSGAKSLHSYLSKQHFGVAEANFYADGGKSLCAMMGSAARDMQDMFSSQELDESDPACAKIKEMLRILKQSSKAEGEGDRDWIDALKAGAKATWEGIKWVGGKVVNLGIAFAKWAADKAFQIGAWIMRNPKTAYFAIMMLKGLRSTLCRKVGSAIGYYGRGTSADWFVKKMKELRPSYVYKPSSSVKELMKDASGWMRPVIIDAAGGAIKAAVDGLWGSGIPILKKALSGTIAQIPIAGPLLSAATEVIIEGAAAASKEAAQLAAEQAIYAEHVKGAFGGLIELINPFQCIDQMLDAQQDEIHTMEYEETRALSTRRAKSMPR